MLCKTKTSGPNRQVKELPVCVSETAYFANDSWLRDGFDLLQLHVRYKGLLGSRLKGKGRLNQIGLPRVVQGYWTEHY